jgi:two-component system nitrogen regulation sensor histidine kinase GlnL
MEPDQLQQAFLNIVRNAVEAWAAKLLRLKTRTVFQITIHVSVTVAAENQDHRQRARHSGKDRDTLFYPR